VNGPRTRVLWGDPLLIYERRGTGACRYANKGGEAENGYVIGTRYKDGTKRGVDLIRKKEELAVHENVEGGGEAGNKKKKMGRGWRRERPQDRGDRKTLSQQYNVTARVG